MKTEVLEISYFIEKIREDEFRIISSCWQGRTAPEPVLSPPNISRKRRKDFTGMIDFQMQFKKGGIIGDKKSRVLVQQKVTFKHKMRSRTTLRRKVRITRSHACTQTKKKAK